MEGCFTSYHQEANRTINTNKWVSSSGQDQMHPLSFPLRSLSSPPCQIPLISHIDSNDMDASVVKSMRRNIDFNGPEVSAKIHPTCSDARMLMMQAGKLVRGQGGGTGRGRGGGLGSCRLRSTHCPAFPSSHPLVPPSPSRLLRGTMRWI